MRPEIRLKPQDFLVSHETRDPMRKPCEAFGQIRHCCYFLKITPLRIKYTINQSIDLNHLENNPLKYNI